MKRKSILLIGAFLLLFSLVASPAFAKNPILDGKMKFQDLPYPAYPVVNEQEPNDTFDSATGISLSDNVAGNISHTDADFYKLTLSSKGYFTLMGQSSNSTSSIGITIYKSLPYGIKEPLEAQYNDTYEGWFYFSNLMLEPGEYFIELTEGNQTLETSSYEFLTMFTEPDVRRISGQDRFETAVEVAYNGWGGNLDAEEIILATGRNFPDALAAAPLAFQKNAPILLTEKDSIPISVIEAIKELYVDKVTIIGGTGAISGAVEDHLINTLGLEVERISGSNRYETSVEIAKRLPESDTAFVVSGQNYPDALSVGSYAALQGHPILLTDPNTLSPVVKNQLANYEKSFVIGGKSAVSDSVLNQLPNPLRISGENRYVTSVKIAEKFFTPDMNYATIATGTNFADALSGSALAARYFEPIILTPPDALSDSSLQLFMQQHTLWFTIIGGKGAVSQNVENQLLQLIQ